MRESFGKQLSLKNVRPHLCTTQTAPSKAQLHKLLTLALQTTAGRLTPRPGEVITAALGILNFEVVACRYISWHTDPLVPVQQATQSILILQTSGHLVQSGKHQNIPVAQQPGTSFTLNVHKRHRLLNNGDKSHIWLALAGPQGKSLEDDIAQLLAAIAHPAFKCSYIETAR